ncbi:MAG: cation diffusion facilitator family transporter [Candidatus Avoscillospira sp.]
MTGLLLKLFVRNSDQVEDPSVRSAYGKLAGLVGIICNVLLFAGKLLAGLISGSVSVMADAVNNLSDASSSVVTLLGFKLAEKPADSDHPFGHARIEYLSGLVVAVMILLIGVELVKSSVDKILHPEVVAFTWLTAGILVASILVKLWMAAFSRTLGKKIDSSTLEATAADSRNDVISTAAVLAAGLVGKFTGWSIDGYAGLAVALFILYSGVSLIKETVDPLLGAATDPELVQEIGSEILSYDKILGIHDLVVHDYGPGRRFASVHVEMDSREDPLACHDLIDDIERDFARKHNLQLVIHYDPVVTDDEELNRMRKLVANEVASIDPRLSIHDFRMVRGPKHTNLIFDLVLPFEMDSRRDELKQLIDQRVQFEDSKYYTVITFDDKAFN